MAFDELFDETDQDIAEGDGYSRLQEVKKRLNSLIPKEDTSTKPTTPITVQDRRDVPFYTNPAKQYDETNIEYQQRVYSENGYDVPASEIKRPGWDEAEDMIGRNPLIVPAKAALDFVYGTVPAVKERYNTFVEKLTSPVENVSDVIHKLSLINPAITSEIDLENMQVTTKQGALDALSYFTSPLSTPAYMLQGALAHNYEAGTLGGNVKELIDASGEGAFRAMFPVYGESPDYGMKITDKFFPGLSPAVRNMSALAIDVLADPATIFSLGTATMAKFGTQINRALIRAGKAPVKAFMREGLDTMNKIKALPKEDKIVANRIITRIEAGDKGAIKELDEFLNLPKIDEWVNEINVKAYDDAADEISNIHGVERGKAIEAELPQAELEFRKGITEAKVSAELKRMREEGITGKKFSRAGGKIYKKAREDVAAMDLTEAQMGKVRQIAEDRADIAIATRAANMVDELENLTSPNSQKQLAELLRKPEYASEIKKRADDILAGKSMWGDITPQVKKALETYKAAGGGKTTLNEIAAKSAKVELETLLDGTINKLWTPEQYLAANIAVNKLRDETVRLALYATHTNSSESILAANKAIDLLTELSGNILHVEEKWGQTGRVMREVKDARGFVPVSREDRLIRYAALQANGKDVNSLNRLNLYLKSDQIGRGTSFLRRGYKLLEATNDSLYEIYVNNLLSGITTHTINFGANTINTVLYPTEKFLSFAVGNRHAFTESYQSVIGIAEGARDAFLVYRDMAMQNKFTGRIWSQKAKDASAFRMLDLADRYPAEYLNPWGYMKSGMGQAVHELDNILKYRKISAPNWGLAPQGVVGKAVDIAGMAVRTPGNLMKFQDSVFKIIGYNMGARSQAYRAVASSRKILGMNKKGMAAQANKLIYNPPKELVKGGKEVADLITFQTKLGKIMGPVDKVLGMRVPAWFVPFRRTNINVVKQMAERSPFGYANALYQMYQGNTAKAQMATVRATLGTIGLWAVSSMVSEDNATGGFDLRSGYGRKMQGLGYQPYQLKAGDNTWISYKDVPYMKSTIGLVMDYKLSMSNLNHRDPMEVDLMNQISAAVIMPFAKMATDPRWVSENAKMLYYIQALSEDPNTIGEILKSDISKIAASTVVPYSALMRSFNRNSFDNQSRIAASYADEVNIAQAFLDQVKLRVPGMSENMPGYTNIYGEPALYPTDISAGWFHTLKNYVSPVSTSNPDMTMVSKELVRVPVNLPPIATHIQGVRLDPNQRSIIQTATGKGVKGNPPLYAAMMRTMASPIYSLSNDRGKAKLLERTYSMYRQAATSALLEESMLKDPSNDSLYNKVLRKKAWNASQFGVTLQQ